MGNREQIGRARRLVHSNVWVELKRWYNKHMRRAEKRAIREGRDEDCPKRNQYKGWAD